MDEAASVAIIDDRKAIALCARKYPNLVVASTLDLFAHNAIVTALGRAPLSDAVYAALQTARMRVPRHYEEWVVGVIGETRASACPSLRGVPRSGLAYATTSARQS